MFRATSKSRPLELKIPIQDAGTGEAIHQLAVRRAMLELEEERGWISDARDEKGSLIKDTYESKWEDIVTRECVRLGTKFQVAGRWCSFVAVEKDSVKNGAETKQVVEEKVSAVDGIRGVARRPRGAQLAARSYYRTSLYGIQSTSASSPGPQLFQGGAPETSLFWPTGYGLCRRYSPRWKFPLCATYDEGDASGLCGMRDGATQPKKRNTKISHQGEE